MKFIDEAKIIVSSGHGGPGAVSFRRESMAPRGGPDGGDGGRGGHVYFRVSRELASLLQFRFQKKFSAQDGHPGEGRNMSGAAGKDLFLEVPVGTVVKAEDGTVILDLDQPGDFLFFEGGRGGKGNFFFRTSVNQAPMHAQPGEEGKSQAIDLELKLIADVGVIGYPNAGKSTLISKISAAKPKIADYPFTTLTPNLGVVSWGEQKTFVIADIPGLIPGAHKGVGLGTQFLRHIERTNLFVHMVDASNFSGRDPLQDYFDIQTELAAYDESKKGTEDYRPLMDREQLVVLNKTELLDKGARQILIEKFNKKGIEARAISGVTGEGLKELIYAIGTRARRENS